MALIHCTECGREISSEAVSCPQCGAPQVAGKRRQRILLRLLTIAGAVLALTAGGLLYDSILFWFPKKWSEGIYAIDWKEMRIAFGAVMAAAGLVFAGRRAFAKGNVLQRFGFLIVPVASVAAASLLGLIFSFQIHHAKWFTHNEVVFLARSGGERDEQTIRFRYLILLPKPEPVLKARIVKQAWDGIAAGTEVGLPNGTKGAVSADLAGINVSLEVHNVSSRPACLDRAPYVGARGKPLWHHLSLLHAREFPAEGIPFGPGEKKVIEFESSMTGYHKIQSAGTLYLRHSLYDDWEEKINPLPPRETLFKKSN